MIETTWRRYGEGNSGREAHWKEEDDGGCERECRERMRHVTAKVEIEMKMMISCEVVGG